MPAIHFRGRVLPQCLNCSLSGIPDIEWFDSVRNTKAKFSITIDNGQVVVSCHFQDGEEPPFMVAYIKALDLAKAAVDTGAFRGGYSLTVIFEQWVNAQGVTEDIVLHDPSLPPLATVFERPNGFTEVLKLVLPDHKLFHTLNDLILSITVPHHSPVNCARVVESIKRMIAGPSLSPKAAWPLMRQALNVDENYLKLITDTSTSPRHGDRVRIEGDITEEIVRRTWTIMNRFLEYRLRGNQQLSLTEFPELKG